MLSPEQYATVIKDNYLDQLYSFLLLRHVQMISAVLSVEIKIRTPSAKQADALNKAGLGKTKIKFVNKNANHKEFFEQIEGTFP